MKAVGYQQSLPIDNNQALLDIEIAEPTLQADDILVAVYGLSVNPVDTKIRQRKQPQAGEFGVLGWDVAGVVIGVGDNVMDFKEGDEVWYAGAVDRAGANAQYHVVDARLVSRKPHSLNFAQAAAMPLTFLTAWELLFERLALTADTTGSLLITGAAGGVGSALIQLAKQLTKLTVIATASRPESQQWVRDLGADLVINHHQPLAPQWAQHGVTGVDYVASLTHTDQHFTSLAELIVPQGKLALIDDPSELLDIRLLKQKSISLHWEFMFTRSMFNTADAYIQGQILQRVAELTDAGILKTTLSEHLGPLTAANLRLAHSLLESHQVIGKLVLDGFNAPD
ncbi:MULTISPECIES: zinc-binding alcohol dehydrogenase family protein [Idiomarina]|uniref:zinc-binding alcohol dehydrogenase family protein n=1 Tax=Idiomarina TaxID=135575 RepID=UPI00129A9F94|nr:MULTISPECIES: zinc-binding alcohol dehydrogenase family protein [Idiomarina]MRJ40749.1 zinc-binding alcohol dehydrogenase family protein [Idiomarina sp. FeN1]NCU56553.1 zinc-binding alcohol dehydrogenase family protein [Idiomarina sp. FenA--70]NCU58933.1 zinc-binding alcohol dehydrogenase family protein [Idiomarina sp. FenBw--71]UUN14567.1 zinc-binding alcohol dehydrogenase family protein [Idiomarina loihiensis]